MPYLTFKRIFDLSSFTEYAIDHFPGFESYYPVTENEVKLDDLNDDRLFEMDMVGDEILIENTIKDKKEEENDDLDLSNL